MYVCALFVKNEPGLQAYSSQALSSSSDGADEYAVNVNSTYNKRFADSANLFF